MNVPDDIIFQMKALDSIKLHELQKLKTRPDGVLMMPPASDLATAVTSGPASQATPANSMQTSASSLDLTCDETMMDCYDDTMIDSVGSSPAIHQHQHQQWHAQSWDDLSSEKVYTFDDDTNADAYSSSGMLPAIRAPRWQADSDALQAVDHAENEGNDVFCSPFIEHWLSSSAPYNYTPQELSKTAMAIAEFCEQKQPQWPASCTRKRASDPETESERRCNVVNMKKFRFGRQ